MAAVFLGATSVGGSVVGLSTAFDLVGEALTDLAAVVDVQLTALVQASTQIDGAAQGLLGIAGALNLNVDAVLAAKAAIRIPAIADFQARLNAAIDIGLQLTADLADPSAYLSALLAGLATVQASLQLALPTVQLTGQISAAASIALMLEAKILAVDLQLEALVSIAASIGIQASLIAQIQLAISAQLSALLQIQIALTAALAAVTGSLSAYAAMVLQLGTAGAYVFLYDGPLSGLGAAIDAVTPLSGISGAASVHAPIVIVETSDTAAVTAVDSVFKVS